jgi:hypothetical protein
VSARFCSWALVALLPGALACTSRSAVRASNAVDREHSIAAVHAHRCASCHAPPEPGEHTRAQLEETLTRHRRRVRLTEDEWRAMVEYLASPRGSTSMQAR